MTTIESKTPKRKLVKERGAISPRSFFSPLDLEIIKKHQLKYLLGTDEVGRGCLAGPVVAACVRIDLANFDSSHFKDLDINDSKKITHKKRQQVVDTLGLKWSFKKESQSVYHSHGLSISLSQISPQMIDKINIFQASQLAMKNATEEITDRDKREYLLIDGKWTLGDKLSSHIEQQAIIKGDSLSWIIGLASIVAKVFRDEMMTKVYARKFPMFHFEKNMGYPTKVHKAAIAHHGIVSIHRKSYQGVKEFISKQKV